MVEVSYDELTRSVPVFLYAQNKTLVAEMPSIIRQAQEELMLRLDHDLFQTVLTVPDVSPGDPLIDLTAEDPKVMEVRAIRLDYRRQGTFTPLERRDLEFLTMLYADAPPGRPRFWAEYGGINTLKLFPAPREFYSLEITANVQPVSLGAAQQQNSITEEFPRAMEQATLYRACVFMKNMADAELYKAEMEASIQEANAALGRRRRDVTGTRPRDTANATGK
jgi:hypothetical protein